MVYLDATPPAAQDTLYMAFSKSLSAYPPAYLELYETAMAAEGNFLIPCESAKQADRTRLIFYGIKHAIRHTKGHPLTEQIDAKQIVITRNHEVLFRLPSESPREVEGQRLLEAAKAANQLD